MKKIKLNNYHKKIFADTITPVEVYLKIRDVYPNSLLLENSDYMLANNNYSFICFNQIGYVKIKNNEVTCSYPGEEIHSKMLSENEKVSDIIHDYLDKFQTVESNFKFLNNGLFGFMSHESVKYFDSIKIDNKDDLDIPDIYYGLYQNIIAISQYNHEAHIFCNTIEDSSNIKSIEAILNNKSYPVFNFRKKGDSESKITDNEYLEYVRKAKEHCKRGDVFQLVLSRRFMQKFTGDEFNVYRALRSINPSPYLFYFDYGSFKLIGSSPEAQIKINEEKAIINPIAGTFRRTGDMAKDILLGEKLSKDQKETAEHVMLVDLARNDLSKHASNVNVEVFKEVQYFSHVIHLVSTVQGKPKGKAIEIVGDTFPAGTLSGAPKFKAMELIDKYENQTRGFYGGAVGFIGLDNGVNLAIAIRSFVSKNNTLYYQAGAGIVMRSSEEGELQEVNNKLAALKKALILAENI